MKKQLLEDMNYVISHGGLSGSACVGALKEIERLQTELKHAIPWHHLPDVPEVHIIKRFILVSGCILRVGCDLADWEECDRVQYWDIGGEQFWLDRDKKRVNVRAWHYLSEAPPKPEGKCNHSKHTRLGDDGETATCCGCGEVIAVGGGVWDLKVAGTIRVKSTDRTKPLICPECGGRLIDCDRDMQDVQFWPDEEPFAPGVTEYVDPVCPVGLEINCDICENCKRVYNVMVKNGR